jgi:chemotaxis protein methyltransferase CheR
MTTHAAPELGLRDEYVAFCDGVRRLCGIDLLQYKRNQMERRIRTFAERRGAADLASYLELLRRDPAEADAFLDRVTINVSQLWRHPDQWELLAREIVPELAAEGRVRAWSAGCSYGAEAYTLAAVCLEVAPQARIEIEGTDIDRRMVARAREGRFSAEDARSAPEAKLRRWFDPAPDGGWVAKEELRRVVRFDVGDLLRMRFRRAAYDLVLCRNTVIYFTEEVTAELHRRLAACLRPGGYLVVGATERVRDPEGNGLEPAHPFIYRKTRWT